MDDDQFEQEEERILLEEIFLAVFPEPPDLPFKISRTDKEFVTFLKAHRKKEIVFSPLIDGARVTLRYRSGSFYGAWLGETDVTGTARVQADVSFSIEDERDVLEITGTFCIRPSKFQIVNKSVQRNRRKTGEKVYETPGDMVKHSLLHLPPRIAGRRNLKFLADGIGHASGDLPCQTHADLLSWVRSLGFKTSPMTLVQGQVSIPEIRDIGRALAKKSPFQVVGVVATVNTATDLIGQCVNETRRARKLTDQKDWTRMKRIWFRIGGRGNLIPHVELDPITVQGQRIRTACTANVPDLLKLDLWSWDLVEIQKGKSPMARIVQIDTGARLKGASPWLPPDKCPSCGGHLDLKNWICTNRRGCMEQNIARLIHVTSPYVLNIPELTPDLLRLFWRDGWIRETADIFTLPGKPLKRILTPNVLRPLEERIETARTHSFSRFLIAAHIPKVSGKVARSIAENHMSWGSVKDYVSYTDLNMQGRNPEIPPGVMHEIRQILIDAPRLGEIDRLMEHMINRPPPRSTGW